MKMANFPGNRRLPSIVGSDRGPYPRILGPILICERPTLCTWSTLLAVLRWMDVEGGGGEGLGLKAAYVEDE